MLGLGLVDGHDAMSLSCMYRTPRYILILVVLSCSKQPTTALNPHFLIPFQRSYHHGDEQFSGA